MRMEGQEKLRQISAHIYAGHAGADKKKQKLMRPYIVGNPDSHRNK